MDTWFFKENIKIKFGTFRSAFFLFPFFFLPKRMLPNVLSEGSEQETIFRYGQLDARNSITNFLFLLSWIFETFSLLNKSCTKRKQSHHFYTRVIFPIHKTSQILPLTTSVNNGFGKDAKQQTIFFLEFICLNYHNSNLHSSMCLGCVAAHLWCRSLSSINHSYIHHHESRWLQWHH